MIIYKAAVASSPSKSRKYNEDNFFFNSKIITDELSGSQILLSHKKQQHGSQIYAVMDGAGSENYRDSASLIAVEKLSDLYASLKGSEGSAASTNDVKKYIDSYIANTDRAVKMKIKELLGMRISTTYALLYVNGKDILVSNVGDTRVYRLRDGSLTQLSVDDTQARRMLEKGVGSPERIKASPKRNKLTQYLGVLPEGEELKPHYISDEAKHNDMYIICSGCVSRIITDDRITELISGKNNAAEVVDSLMSEAIESGVKEDATIMAVQAKDSTVFADAPAAAVPVVASGIVKSSARREKMYNNDNEEKGPEDEENDEDKTETKSFIPLLIAGIIILMVILMCFGIKVYKNSNKPVVTSTVMPTEQPTNEPTQVPTKIPTATPRETPSPTPGSDRTPTPGPTQTPTAEPERTPVPTPTPTNSVNVSVDRIVVNKTNAQLYANETLQVGVTFYPYDATDKTLVWTSSDSEIASVDGNGIITALKKGTATITVTASSGVTSTVIVTVEYILIENVEISETEKEMKVGDEFNLSCTVTPEDAFLENIVWKSTDGAVAEVDENGHVTAVGAGTATIKATALDGTESPVTVECVVTVSDIVGVTSVELEETEVELAVGDTKALIANVLPENADNKKLVWSSDTEECVLVDENGMISAVAVGSAVITVRTEDGDFTATCIVTVTTVPAPEEIQLDKTEISIAAGGSYSLIATVLPEDARDKSLIWTSDNEEVATVDENGLVSAVGEGTTTIHAVSVADNNVKAECVVTVEPVVDVISLTPSVESIEMAVGDRKKQPSVTINPENATYTELTWAVSEESANPECIEIREGFIYANSEGTAAIIISDVTGTVTATITVTVSE